MWFGAVREELKEETGMYTVLEGTYLSAFP